MNIKKIIGAVLLTAGIAASFFQISQRLDYENNSKEYNYVIDMNELEKFSDYSGESIESWLGFFSDNGIKYAALTEENVNSLIKNGYAIEAELYKPNKENLDFAYSNSELLKYLDDGELDKYDLVVKIYDDELFSLVKEGIEKRYEKTFYLIFPESKNNIIVFDGTGKDLIYSDVKKFYDSFGEGFINDNSPAGSKLEYIGLFYNEENIEAVKNSGMNPILRPINYERFSESLVDNYINTVDKLNPEQKYVIFYGKEVLGFPEGIEKLSEYINAKGMDTVLIESSTQREHLVQLGMEKLTENTKYSAVRAFTMWDYIRTRFAYYNYSGTEEIDNTIYRAVSERNIRLIYFKPYLNGDYRYVTDKSHYVKSLSDINERLRKHNIILGNPVSQKYFDLNYPGLFFMSLGLLVTGQYLLKRMVKSGKKADILIFIAGIAGFAGIILLNKNFAQKIFALASAVIFPSIAVYYTLIRVKDYVRKPQKRKIIYFINTITASFAVVLLGGIYTASFLSETPFLLETDIFRGVKISQIAPVIIAGLFFLNEICRRKEETFYVFIKNLLTSNVKIYYVITALAVGISGYVYLARTGHESNIQPSDAEMIARNFLENLFIARPRTKEFLFAFPGAFAFFFFMEKSMLKSAGISLSVYAVGLASVVNTFTHIRSPLYLSVTRSVISLIIGICAGILIYLFMNAAYKVFNDKNTGEIDG